VPMQPNFDSLDSIRRGARVKRTDYETERVNVIVMSAGDSLWRIVRPFDWIFPGDEPRQKYWFALIDEEVTA
jgi:hypothetical protein